MGYKRKFILKLMTFCEQLRLVDDFSFQLIYFSFELFFGNGFKLFLITVITIS